MSPEGGTTVPLPRGVTPLTTREGGGRLSVAAPLPRGVTPFKGGGAAISPENVPLPRGVTPLTKPIEGGGGRSEGARLGADRPRGGISLLLLLLLFDEGPRPVIVLIGGGGISPDPVGCVKLIDLGEAPLSPGGGGGNESTPFNARLGGPSDVCSAACCCDKFATFALISSKHPLQRYLSLVSPKDFNRNKPPSLEGVPHSVQGVTLESTATVWPLR